MTPSSENVLRSPAGKITQSCRHHCETDHTGPQFVDHHGHVAVHSAGAGRVKRVRGHARTKPGTQGPHPPEVPCGPRPRLALARERCGPARQGRRSLGRGTRAASASIAHLRTRRILPGARAAAYCAGVTGWSNTLSLSRPTRLGDEKLICNRPRNAAQCCARYSATAKCRGT
jgi:hypothetical protein